MNDFNEHDWICENNNIDFKAYHKFTNDITIIYLNLKKERDDLDNEMTNFSEQQMFANFMHSLIMPKM